MVLVKSQTRKAMEQNREVRKRLTHNTSKLIFNKDVKVIQSRKIVFSINSAWNNGIAIYKTTLIWSIPPIMKYKFKIPNHKTSIRKQEKSLGPWIRQRFLIYDIKSTIHKRKEINKLEFIKMKNFCSSKDTVTRKDKL